VRLRTNIFLWVALATVVPLTALALAATLYSEHRYRREAEGEIHASLNTIVAELDRRLRFERGLLASLATSPAVKAFEPSLEAAMAGHRDPGFATGRERLTGFLEAFGQVMADIGTLRVLDAQGNTLIKVQNGERSPPAYAGMAPYPYAEAEVGDPGFARRLHALPAEEVGYMVLPPSRAPFEALGLAPALNAVRALRTERGTVGFLMLTSTGLRLERTLTLAPRLHGGQLLVAELNPDNERRDGLILHEDAAGIGFASPRHPGMDLERVVGGDLRRALAAEPFGVVTGPDPGQRIYYQEYLPYPSRLISWVVASRVDAAQLAAPFARIRWSILLLAALTVGLGLLLAQMSARRLAHPIDRLAGQLTAYGRGSYQPPAADARSDEIRQLQGAFRDMAANLERARQDRDRAEGMMRQSAKLASIGQLAAGIGHELNNPLNNILGLTRLAERSHPEDEGLRADLRSIREEAERASETVEGILNFARQVPPQYSEIELDGWLREGAALVAQAAADKGVHLETGAEPGLRLQGDRRQLQQVLINLLINAIDSISASTNSESGEIRLETQEIPKSDENAVNQSPTIRLTVYDNGTGIAREEIDNIFDPFYTTKEPGKGTGLGLSVSYMIIEQFGGAIKVNSEVNHGTALSIYLQMAA